MANTNTNDSNVVGNNNGLNSGTVLDTGVFKPSITSGGSYGTSVGGVQTVLNNVFPRNTGGMDDPATENGDYEVATAIATGNFLDSTPLAGLSTTVPGSNFATLLDSNVPFVQFLPTEQVAKPEWAATGTPGSYLTGASWAAAPKAVTLTPNASAFTLTNTNDGGKTVVLSETISGAPFTTGNGAVSEALVFRGTANDTLVVKHNVAVANVPALTNNNNGSALDVRNENYAETYAKQGVNSSYAWNSAHKYAEVNGNQSLNDAFVQNYVYNDANLTINSAVKTAVADAAYINGVERIVESNVANYNYVHKTTGSVNYVVTDTRNLAQVDQRTWTNTTVTNVAKFEVIDKTNDGKTTITAKGLITGTTDNISTAKAAATPTTFKATNAEFKVVSDHYTLTVDPTEFNVDHAGVPSNALLTLVDSTARTGDVFESALGDANANISPKNVAGNVFSMADAFNPYVSDLVGANASGNVTLTGTQFKDVITVKDTAAAPFNGNINGGAGNDTITGGFGADSINGDAGKDVIEGGAGNDTIDGGAGDDSITVSAGTDTIVGYTSAEPKVGEVKAADGTVTTAAKAEIVHDVITLKAGAAVRIADAVDPTHKFYTVTNPVAATTDLTIKTADEFASAQKNVTFDYSKETTDQTIDATAATDNILTGTAGNYTVNGFALGTDTLTVAKGTTTATVTVLDATGVPTIYTVVANATTDTVIPATVKTAADLALTSGVKAANPFNFSDSPAAITKVTGDTNGDDSVLGSAFDDTLAAGKGNDTIKAGNGDDKLAGGEGSDLLQGGDGKDVFAFVGKSIASLGADTITDFVSGTDKIQLDSSIFKGVNIGSLSPTPDSNNYAASSVDLSAVALDLNGTSPAGGGIVAIGAGTGNAGVSVYYTSNMNAATAANSTLIVTLTGLNTTQVDVTDFFGL